MKNYYIFTLENGEVMQESFCTAIDSVCALYQSGALPVDVMPELSAANDMAFFTNDTASRVVVAQRR